MTVYFGPNFFGQFLWGQTGGSGSVQFEWDDQIYWLYNRNFFLKAGVDNAPYNTSAYYVYVDGTVKPGTTNELEIQKSFIEPREQNLQNIEIVLYTDVLTDTDGSITGIKGRKYIHTKYYPLSIVSAEIDGVTITTASKLDNSDIVDLGVTNDFIYCQVVYEYRYQFTYLGIIETNGSEIIYIGKCGRPGVDCRMHDVNINTFGGEIFIRNSSSLTTKNKEQIRYLLHLLKPAHTKFFLFFEGGYGGAKTYYATI